MGESSLGWELPGSGPGVAVDGQWQASGRKRRPDGQSEGRPVRPESTEGFVTKYELPELPYDYAALEPHISARIMELHHDKHHATYVAGANTALEKMAEARANGDAAAAAKLSKDLQFNLGGHINHSIFWN